MSQFHHPVDDPPLEPIPKLLGADAEKSNFITGPGAVASNTAALRIVAEVPGVRPARHWAGVVAPAAWTAGACDGLGDPDAFTQARDLLPPGYSADAPEWGRVWLKGGGCIYVDMLHCEAAIPIVRSAREFVAYHRAMDLHIARAAARANRKLAPGCRIHVHANNTVDGGVNAWGSHINVLISREGWDRLFRAPGHELAYLASAQASSVFLGAGALTRSPAGRQVFVLSQRALTMTRLWSVATTSDRGMVNRRDEPLANAPYARLHTIFWDALRQETAEFLRAGIIQILAAQVEVGAIDRRLIFCQPVRALHWFNADPSFRHRAPLLISGAQVTAIQHQRRLLETARRFCASGVCDRAVPEWRAILTLWSDVLDMIDRGDQAALERRLDWALKRRIIRQTMARDPRLSLEAPVVAVVEQLYSSIDPERGLHQRLQAAGHVERVHTDAAIRRAAVRPPCDTRAAYRAAILRHAAVLGRLGVEFTDVDWDCITLSAYAGPRRGATWRLEMGDPTVACPFPDDPLPVEAAPAPGAGLLDWLDRRGGAAATRPADANPSITHAN